VIVGSNVGKFGAAVGIVFVVIMIIAGISRAAGGPPITSASDWLGFVGAGLFALVLSAMLMAGIVIIIGDVAVRSPMHGWPLVRLSNEELSSWNVMILRPLIETRVIGLADSRRRLIFVGKVTLPYVDDITTSLIREMRDNIGNSSSP